MTNGESAAQPAPCEYREIPLNHLRSDPAPVTSFNPASPEDAALLASVRKFGVLIPLLVGPEVNGGHVIIDGHRRVACARLLGLPIVPCRVANSPAPDGYATHRFVVNTTAKRWTQAERKA